MQSWNTSKKRFLNTPTRWGLLLFFLFLFLGIAFSAFEARKTSDNRVSDWLPDSFPETRKLALFNEYFGGDSLMMVSWDGLTAEDPQQEVLADRLMRSGPVDEKYFKSVLTTRQLLPELEARIADMYQKQRRLVKPPKPIREIAQDRLDGWLISKDRTQGCLVVIPKAKFWDERGAVLDEVYEQTMRVTGRTHQQIHIAGGICDSVAIDRASAESQQKLLPFFLMLCFLLLAICLRNWILSVSVLIISLVNEELGPAFIFLTGSHMDSVSLLISALLFVLTVESGIHLSNYYRDSVAEGGVEGAVRRTIAKGWVPCFLATFTTILGMGSLAISTVKPIQNFGIFASLALFCGTFLLFMYLGTIWETFPPLTFRFFKRKNQESVGENVTERKTAHAFTLGCWEYLGRFIAKSYVAIIATSVGFLIFGLVMMYLFKLQTTVTLHGMLPKSNEVLQDYDYLEDTFGGLVSIEVQVNIPDAKNQNCDMLEHCELIRRIERDLKELRDADGTRLIDGTMSVLTFLPDLPDLKLRGARATMFRSAMASAVEENTDTMKQSGFYYEGPEEKVWRVSLHVPSGKRTNYEPLLREIELQVFKTLSDLKIGFQISDEQRGDSVALKNIQPPTEQELVQKKGTMNFRDVTVVVTGAVPLVFKAQEQLLKDLISSFLTAFLLIMTTLIFLLRGVRAGLICMLPNILPSVVVFGLLALAQVKVDIGSMMTASVALGITVDGTLHLLTWFKRGIALGHTRQEAVVYAYTHCADAMLQTAFICSFAFLVFGFSGFVPVARFAWMLCILLTAAIVADLFLTPALLVSPLGKLFVRKGKKE